LIGNNTSIQVPFYHFDDLHKTINRLRESNFDFWVEQFLDRILVIWPNFELLGHFLLEKGGFTKYFFDFSSNKSSTFFGSYI
jgi:hypothetical protein